MHSDKKTAITIGNFDGQHIGHRLLFNQVREVAAQRDREPVIFTFLPHPAFVLKNNPGFKLITTYAERKKTVEEYGVFHFIEQAFTPEFAKTEPEDFLRFLSEKLNCTELIIGECYRFGKGAAGHISEYIEFASSLGIEIMTQKHIYIDGVKVSSSLVRELISRKDFKTASACLGRSFYISGTHIREHKLLPPPGKYNTLTDYGNKKLNSITAILENGGIVNSLPAEEAVIEFLSEDAK